MMRIPLVAACLLLASVLSAEYTGYEDAPYAGAAGTAGSTAIHYQDPGIAGWASSFRDLSYGPGVAANWKTPERALGPAGTDPFDIVCLGDSGTITLSFGQPIRNGSGFDFAVFENAFSDNFLELAWVEVSSDGVHFVRFPNYSLTASASAVEAAQNGSVLPWLLFGYGGKYRQGYGTPFDLEELAGAYAAALAGEDDFIAPFRQDLLDNFPHLDLQAIRYVRLVDVIGDGTAFSCLADPNDPERRLPIYDPWPTAGSPGFDLDGVAVLNQAELAGTEQTIDFAEIPNQLLSGGSVLLEASSSSGLPVSLTVLDGPAEVDPGNASRLLLAGLGVVLVEASQPGDLTYAPAAPVVRSFYVAEAFQHIYFEPVSNKLTGSNSPLHAGTSSGLIPVVEVVAGPADVSVGFPPNQALTVGSTTGTVELRVFRDSGDVDGIHYAPAEPVRMTFEIVAPGDPLAPLSFAEWQANEGVAGEPGTDSDLDGTADFIEFAAGTDPDDPSDRPAVSIERNAGGLVLEFGINRRADVRVVPRASDELGSNASWSDAFPEMLLVEPDGTGPYPVQRVRLRVESGGAAGFWQVRFEEN